MGLIWTARKTATKITRWAKANPKKTQGLIAGIQLPLLGLGVMNGHNLNQMGYELSDTIFYGFGAATALGFLSVPFMPKPDTIAIPKQVNRKRLAFLGIAISSLMMMTGFGNRIEQNYPNTRLAQTVESIDQSVFSENNATHNDVVGSDTKSFKSQKSRQVAGAGMCALAVLLILLLVVTLCAGVCLIIFGIGGAFAGGGAVLAVLGGLLISFLSVLGISKVSKWCKKSDSKQQR